MVSLVVIWEGLTAAVVMSNTIFRIHKKPRSLHGADYKKKRRISSRRINCQTGASPFFFRQKQIVNESLFTSK